MKKLFTLSFIIFLTLEVSGQIYTDIKQLSDAGVVIPPQDLLSFGIGNCDLGLIKSAIAKGADLNKELQAGSYILPLVSAVSGASTAMLPDDENIIASQIQEYGSEVFSGRSVSDLRRDYIEIIRFLLQNGAKPNVSTDYSFGGIPLLKASEYRDIEIVKLLLDFNADPNSVDDAGFTALHMLGTPGSFSYPYRDSADIAKLLISKGAKMTKIHMTGETPLASTKETLRIIEDTASPWRDYPFYNELVNSLKSLIDIYSKI
jgi:hypothetical protein